MTTPSGSISASNIRAEFGPDSGAVSLGSYRISQTKGALTLAIGDGIPTSGAISYDQMRNKRLNIVVDYYADNANLNRTDNGDNTMNAQNRYENQNERVHVIGGLKSKPNTTSGHRVRINVHQTLGGKKGESTVCALRTGNWDANTDLIVEIGSNGKIYGGGGDGGEGGNTDAAGVAGENGASALGIDHNGTIVNVASGGLLRCGFGGGGGGATEYNPDPALGGSGGGANGDIASNDPNWLDGPPGSREGQVNTGGGGGAKCKGHPTGYPYGELGKSSGGSGLYAIRYKIGVSKAAIITLNKNPLINKLVKISQGRILKEHNKKTTVKVSIN